VIQRYARMRVLSSTLVSRPDHPRLLVTGHRHAFAYEPRPGFLYVRSRAISSRTNDNYDTFPAAEIKKAWRTFIGKPVFVNHANANPRRARGVVVDAALHEDVNPDGSPDVWVEALMEVDAVRFPKLAAAILKEEVDRTSMGANVEYSLCSFCGNRAETPLEYCAHVKTMKGQRVTRRAASGRREAVLVSEVCYGLGFFENSLLVEQPADPTAHVVGVDARGLDAPTRTTSSLEREPHASTRLVATASRREATQPGERLDEAAALQAEAAPRHADPGDHPFFQANPVHADHIVAHWGRATPDEREQGKRWYGDAHIVAKAIAHGDAHKGAGVLAAYSPQTAWPVNMFNAARSLHTGTALGGPGSGVFATGSMKGQAQRIIDGEHHQDVLKGPKIQDFAHLIEHGGDADPAHPRAVIDRHAMSVAAGKRFGAHDLDKAPLDNRHYYGHVVAAYHEAARRISETEGHPVEPHQVQATTWLVRQRENVQEDDANADSDQLDKGRRTNRGHDRERWDQWSHEHYPELHGPGYHSGSARLGYGEQVAPAKVDTLRPEDCPICGDTETFDGDQCQVCGYVAPPDQFTDPDLEMARGLDQEGDDGAEDPAADAEEDPDDLDDEGDDEEEDDEPDDDQDEDDDRPPLATSGAAHPEGVGVRMSTSTGRTQAVGAGEGKNPAGEQRVRLLAAMRAQQNLIEAQGARLTAQERVGQQVVAQLDRAVGLLGVIVDLAGLSGHPKAAALAPPQDARTASFHAGRRQGALDHQQHAALDTAAKADEWGRADDAWKDGWTAGYEASRRTAAGDQRGDPVPTTNEQALAPAATDDPQAYGAAPAPANQGVTPAATTDVQSTDVALPAVPFNQLTDVTAPTPADISAPPPVQDSHVPQQNETLTTPDLQPAMTDTGWTTGSADSRFFAALGLARLRRAAGITRRDELEEAQAIVADATATPQVVAAATQTLQDVLGAGRRTAASTARRDLVPTPAGGGRSMPSVAGTPGVQVAAASPGAVVQAEFLDLA
jgi:hypothetical protein